MMPLLLRKFSTISLRKFSSGPQDKFTVTIIGASSKVATFIMIGLKQSKYVKELRAYDDSKKSMSGLTMDLDGIPTEPKVVAYSGKGLLRKCLLGTDVVAICGGCPQQPGEKQDEHFKANAKLIRTIVPEIGRVAPFATTVIITEPINSLVPMAATYLLKERAFEPERLLGATGIDVARAQVYLARKMELPSSCVKIPVIGGHSDKTMLPLLSQAEPCIEMKKTEAKCFIEQVRNAAKEVLETKGSAPVIGPGWAYASLIDSILKGKSGKKNVFETVFMQSDVSDASFFSSRVKFGKCGVKNVCPLPKLSCAEQKALKKLLPVLQKEVSKGCAFANKNVAESGFCKKKQKKSKKD